MREADTTANWKTAMLAGQLFGWVASGAEVLGNRIGHRMALQVLVVAPTFFLTMIYWVVGKVRDRKRFQRTLETMMPGWGRMLVWFLSAATANIIYYVVFAKSG